ncbi:MAG: hypothetical protein ACKOC0_13755, partial [Cytophagales bacterium]
MALKKGVEYYTDSYTKAEKDNYYKWLYQHSDLSRVSDERKKSILDAPGLSRATVLSKNSFVTYLRYNRVEFTQEDAQIFKCFAKVFEQAYTRFLDLQRADAQARKAQIEAALERIRSRSIGMQKSNELADVVLLINEEILRLGIEIDNTSINTDFSKNGDSWFIWLAAKGKQYLEKCHIPNSKNIVHDKIWDAIENEIEYYTESYTKIEKDEYFTWLYKNSDLSKTDEERKKYVFNTPGWTRATVLSKSSILIFQRYKQLDFTQENAEIFKRFAKVFDQTYTRFLDLQRAETQAREAQIETALERVRAASMAMQTSEQLLDVIKVVGQQLEKLGLQFDSTNFRTNVGEKDWDLWIYAKWMDKPAKWFIPYIDHPYFKMTDKDGEIVSSIFSRQEKDSFEAYLYKLGLIVPPKDPEVAARQKEFMDAAKGFAMSIANVKSISLNIANSQAQPYSKEDNALLLRFAVVFEQAYVRFLDLQKAEAQARESQIQLALERVRARTMAMHKSSELSEVVKVLFEEFKKLHT